MKDRNSLLVIAENPPKPSRDKNHQNNRDNDAPPSFRVRMFFHCIEEGQRKLLCGYSWRLNSAMLAAIMTIAKQDKTITSL